MVTRGYFAEEEPTFRRCGPRGQSYPLAQERSDHSYPPRTYSDGRSNDRGPENTEPGHHQMRRRIQVACQRCRKRKIRCSGEDNGRPCYHCKQSSSEPCEFLRVTAMRLEQAKDLPADCFDDSLRPMYRMPSNASYNNNYYQTLQTLNLGPDSINLLRPSYSNYGFQGPKYLNSSYDNFTEEPAEFNLSSSTPYQVAAQDSVSVSNYPVQSNGRTRVNPPAPMYMDSEATANYNSAYQSYNARSMVDSESKNFCVPNNTCIPSYGTASAATTSSQAALNVATTTERQLPYPNRQYGSTNDGAFSSQNSLQPYGFMSSNVNSSAKINSSIQMPLTNPYMSVSTSSPHEITTAAATAAYQSGQQSSLSQQDSEIYDASTINGNLYYTQTNESTTDISHYGTSSGSEPSKSRQNSQTNTTDNTWPANNRKSSGSGSSLLANGQTYVPHTSSHYPTPNLPTQMQNHGLLQLPSQMPPVSHDGLPAPSREYVSSLSSR
ncbi:uncharacterized protein EAE98_003710 [Botrytis deweyae]|uniref:Zn(2)-C6 fungal-type domain-containing protein n=1 Tax=Botrytis deweyae TaxID=2478750 RepID=A0ABQ7IUG1_9HELO|nr:uncharacterized protein EAE98_003710 [Botrytis deweyae]KAF7934001.1 hypothetical protein EAE98_003710 [Botrytis deweyae]